MGTDVLHKVRGNLEHHEEFGKSYKKALHWIEDAKAIIAECSQSVGEQRKERLQCNLAEIQVIFSNSQILFYLLRSINRVRTQLMFVSSFRNQP